MTIQSILNNFTINSIQGDIKNKNTQAFFIGSLDFEDFELEKLIKDPNITIEEVKFYNIVSTKILRAYIDPKDKALTFEIFLDYDFVSNSYIYALAIARTDGLLAIAPIPKIKKYKGIGGTFIFKTIISDVESSMIFKGDDYVTNNDVEFIKNVLETKASELIEVKRNALNELNTAIEAKNTEVLHLLEDEVSATQDRIEIIKDEVIQELRDKKLQVLLNDLGSFIDKELAQAKIIQADRAKVGKTDYFYRNNLPNDYAQLGQTLQAKDYPILWFYTLGTALNNGSTTFKLPKANMYSKGTQSIREVGEFKESSLPDWNINLNALMLSGSGNALKSSGTNSYIAGSGASYGFNRAEFSASSSSPIYGRGDEVEVRRNNYLEGIYAGIEISKKDKK